LTSSPRSINGKAFRLAAWTGESQSFPAPAAARVLAIEHLPGARDDRVSAWLERRGLVLDWRCPALGDPLPEVRPGSYCLVVVHGGLQSANDAATDPAIAREIDWIGRWVRAGGRYLGLCLGAQLLARALGARVAARADGRHEIGFTVVRPAAGASEFLAAPMRFYQWHREGFELPAGARRLACGERFANQAFSYRGRAYGVQFHPEVHGAMIERWSREAAPMLAAPGADPPERQLADWARHGPAMSAWLEAFLARLLGTVSVLGTPVSVARSNAPG